MGLPQQRRTAWIHTSAMSIEQSPLILAFQDLVRAKDASELGRRATANARALLGADGCTLVLRDGDACAYVEEDAIAPLWKGRRFALDACMPGLVMRSHGYLVIGDVRDDPRVPREVYAPTFVRGLALVSIGRDQALGALEACWSEPHEADASELERLRTLAEAAELMLSGCLRHA